MTNPTATLVRFGPLVVHVRDADGAILAVQDRISGQAASLLYRPQYIDRATVYAAHTWAARADH